MLSRYANHTLKFVQRSTLYKNIAFKLHTTSVKPILSTLTTAKYSTSSSEKFGVYDDSEFLDEFGNFEILDFESSLNKLTSDFLLTHGDKPITKKALDKYWGLIIKDYEAKCKFTDSESLQMDTALLEHYYKFVSNTSGSNLLASDLLSKYINVLTLIKAGSIRDFSVAKGTMEISEDQNALDEMNLSINNRFINVFDTILKILNFVPLTEKSQDIPIHFFYIVYLRFMNELSFQGASDVTNQQIKVVKFCLNEFLKNKDLSLNELTSMPLKRFQKIQFSSLSTHSKIDTDNIESIRALQKCIVYRILITQDEKAISNVWDSIYFRSGYYNDNVLENWNIFIEQMEKIFLKDNIQMTDAMRVYTATHLLSVLTEDLITFSEAKIPEGEKLILRLKNIIKVN